MGQPILIAMAAKIDASRKSCNLKNSKFLIINPHSQNRDNPCGIVTASRMPVYKRQGSNTEHHYNREFRNFDIITTIAVKTNNQNVWITVQWFLPTLWPKNFDHWPWISLIDWVFYPFLIDLARLCPVEWSSVSLGAKMLWNIFLDSLRKCQEMAVAYSVLVLDRDFPC